MLLVAFIATTGVWAQDCAEVSPFAATTPSSHIPQIHRRAAASIGDLVMSFTGTSAGQQAICTDGSYIYTASWQTTPTGGYTFYQYNLDGTFVEGFDIAGAIGIRDLTYDGTYFYGTSGGSKIFKLDFSNRTLVGTITCSGLTSRHISYDPVRDGFWSGNWSDVALYDRSGNKVQTGPSLTSAYGSAYYADTEGEEHLLLFCQPNSDVKVYDYNITTNTLSSDYVFDLASSSTEIEGMAGGCCIADYNGQPCFFANVQQDPNFIGVYALPNAVSNNGTYDIVTGTIEHGSVKYFVDEEEVDQANVGETVTVEVTPEDGWITSNIIVMPLTNWEVAAARGDTHEIDIWQLDVAKGELPNQWTFLMPEYDVEVSNTVCRDMGYGVAVTVNGEATNGQTTPRFRVVKDDNDKYVPETALTYALLDLLPNPQQPTTLATTDYSFVKLQRLDSDGTTWIDLDNNAELIPGIYCASFTATEGSNYSGICYSGEFELYAQFDITLTAGNDYEIDGTVASITTKEGQDAAVDVTANIDENGTLVDVKPGATVTVTAAEGYVFTAFAAIAGPSNTDIATLSEDGTEATFTMPENNVAISYTICRDLSVSTTLNLFIDDEEMTEATRLRIKKNDQGVYEPVNELGVTLTDEIENVTLTIQQILAAGMTPTFYLLDENEEWQPVTNINQLTMLPANVAPGQTYRMTLTAGGQSIYTGETAPTIAITLFEGFEVEVPAGEYITYYKDKALCVEDAEAKLYTVVAVAEETVTITELGVAPALTPLLVYNGGNETKTILLISTEREADNISVYEGFKGTLEGETLNVLVGCDKYAFNGKQFAWVKDALSIDANKAWLEVVTGTAPTARNLALNIVGNGVASFTITFKDNGRENDSSSEITDMEAIVADGADYLESVTSTKVFNAKAGWGIKLGTSSVNGSITLTLKENVKATKIVTTARKYNDNQHALTVNGEQLDLGTGNEFADYELTYASATEISSIAFEATNKRAYITSVTVYYEPATSGGEGSTTLSDEEFDLTVGSTAHGTIAFYVNEEEVEKAKEGDVVTVEITPIGEYVAAEATGLWYAGIAAARGSQLIDILTDIELTPVEGNDNQWTFVMQRANAEISTTYWDLGDIIEQLRKETELAKDLFLRFGDTKDVDTMKDMYNTINQSIALLRKHDNGEAVSIKDANELLKALKQFNALFNDVYTGIANVNRETMTSNRYYDLNGRKVTNPTKKGVYILNGKRVVIR